jgi:hypothetical protein
MPILKEIPTTADTLRDHLMELYQKHKDETCMIDLHLHNVTINAPHIYIFDLYLIDVLCDKLNDGRIDITLRFKDQEETS